MTILNVTKIRNPWLRFGVLLGVGAPIFSGWPLTEFVVWMEARTLILYGQMGLFEIDNLEEIVMSVQSISFISAWICYACILYLIILSTAGQKRLLEYLGAAFVLGLITVLSGSVIRTLIPWFAGDRSEVEIVFLLLRIFVVTLAVVPYFFFFVNCFSARGIVERVGRKTGKFWNIGLHIALLLRMFQHTGEVIFSLLDIWKEEHPEMIFPRHRKDWKSRWYSSASIVPWVWSAVLAWITAAVVYTLEPVPIMVDELKRIRHQRRSQ